jgi:exopolysaccharide biosynthesis WecB/TagA/CpsF family protein
MVDYGRKNILGVEVNAVDYASAVERIIGAAHRREPLAVSALAVHGVMTGAMDREQQYRLNHLDLLVPDGQPVRWALNALYQTKLSERVYGPALMLKICERAAADGLPIYLYGSQPHVVESLVTNLSQRLPTLRIAGAQPSRFRQTSRAEREAISKEIRESGACITFVGLGCPRQETWAFEYRDWLQMPIVAVGAAFDFHAGTLPQAPTRLQRAGLEWLYRLLQEPRRLWKRYLYLNPLYLVYLFLQATHLKRFDPERALPPSQDKFYG